MRGWADLSRETTTIINRHSEQSFPNESVAPLRTIVSREVVARFLKRFRPRLGRSSFCLATTACDFQRPLPCLFPVYVPPRSLLRIQGAQGTSNNAPARLPAPATPVAASAAPAPAATPPPANGGGGGGGGGGEVSVSDIFRERGVKFHIKLAATVGIRAKKMYVQECGKVAGKLLRKRPALDRYMNEMPAPWDWGRSVPENVYPASYRGMLHEAFDSVFGVVAP